jgi:UDP-glucose 4-epimerase
VSHSKTTPRSSSWQSNDQIHEAVAATFALRLQPSEPGWLDMALAVPLLDSARARTELGWGPRHTGTGALSELLEAMRQGTDYQAPPLARPTSRR